MRRLAILALFMCALLGGAAWAAPKAQLWPRWEAHVNTAHIEVDHEPWQAFLRRYLVADKSGINLVDYAEVSPEDRFVLAQYVRYLSVLSVSRLTRDQQLAYWINLYNALTVKVVLDHYPVKSIRDIKLSPSPFTVGPWTAKLLTIEGEPVSLNDIEHRILRPIWRDPRLHYVLNCAALGCPNLMMTAFRADRVNMLLDAAAHGYVNHPRGVKISGVGITVSSIYKWYGEDFGGSDAAILQHIRRYARPELQQVIDDIPRIEGYGYDWRLNDVATLKAKP